MGKMNLTDQIEGAGIAVTDSTTAELSLNETAQNSTSHETLLDRLHQENNTPITSAPLTALNATAEMPQPPDFSKLVSSSGLPLSDKMKAFELIRQFPESSSDLLADLFQKKTGGAETLMLLEKDSKGNTLFNNLYDLTTAENYAHPDIVKYKDEMLISVVKDLVNPGQMFQGVHETCVSTTAAWGCALYEPAEFSRLTRGLLLDGQVEFQKAGEILTLETDAINPDHNRFRSFSNRVMQASLMEYANGSDLDYINGKDKHFYIADPSVKPGSGLLGSQTARLQEAFYDKKYSFIDGTSSSDLIIKMIADISKEEAVLTALYWTDKAPDKNGESAGSHLIGFTKIESGRVFFKNPSTPVPEELVISNPGPERRIEDNAKGLESMLLKDFKERLKMAIVSDDQKLKFFRNL